MFPAYLGSAQLRHLAKVPTSVKDDSHLKGGGLDLVSTARAQPRLGGPALGRGRI